MFVLGAKNNMPKLNNLGERRPKMTMTHDTAMAHQQHVDGKLATNPLDPKPAIVLIETNTTLHAPPGRIVPSVSHQLSDCVEPPVTLPLC